MPGCRFTLRERVGSESKSAKGGNSSYLRSRGAIVLGAHFPHLYVTHPAAARNRGLQRSP